MKASLLRRPQKVPVRAHVRLFYLAWGKLLLNVAQHRLCLLMLRIAGMRLHLHAYWRGTAKRLIRINWIDIWGVQTIHRFGHQSGPGKRSGGLSTAKIHVFSTCVFLDGSENRKNTKTNKNTGPGIQNTGQDITNKCKFMEIIYFHVFLDISMYFHVLGQGYTHLECSAQWGGGVDQGYTHPQHGKTFSWDGATRILSIGEGVRDVCAEVYVRVLARHCQKTN